MALAVLAWPIGARAQWGISYNEHDWRITVGGKPYGLVQNFSSFISLTNGVRQTTIYLGAYKTTTRLRAPVVAIALFLSGAAAGAFVARGLFPEKRGA
jgi:hypothetical protein